MSLTRILDRPSVREGLGKRIRRPSLPTVPVRVAPVTGAEARVGIGIDLLIRAALHAEGWAERPDYGVRRALRVLTRRPDLGVDLRRAASVAEEAEARLDTQRPRVFRREAAEAALILGGFDVVFRSGRADQVFREPAPSEVDELAALFEIVPWDGFRPSRRLVVGPSFGEGSRALGGADADLIRDDAVVEIKTMAEASVPVSAVRQGVCYALLANRFGVNGEGAGEPIARVEFYLARGGALVGAPLSAMIAAEDRDAALELILGEGAGSRGMSRSGPSFPMPRSSP